MHTQQSLITGAVVLAGLLSAAPVLQAEPGTASPTASATLAVKKLSVNGMMCFGCVEAVEGALKNVTGVTQVEVSLEGHEAVVEYDPAQVDPEVLVAAVIESGFEAALKDVDEPEKDADLPESEATQE